MLEQTEPEGRTVQLSGSARLVQVIDNLLQLFRKMQKRVFVKDVHFCNVIDPPC